MKKMRYIYIYIYKTSFCTSVGNQYLIMYIDKELSSKCNKMSPYVIYSCKPIISLHF